MAEQLGEYGPYILAAYGISVFALAGLSFYIWRAYGTAKRRARHLKDESQL